MHTLADCSRQGLQRLEFAFRLPYLVSPRDNPWRISLWAFPTLLPVTASLGNEILHFITCCVVKVLLPVSKMCHLVTSEGGRSWRGVSIFSTSPSDCVECLLFLHCVSSAPARCCRPPRRLWSWEDRWGQKQDPLTLPMGSFTERNSIWFGLLVFSLLYHIIIWDNYVSAWSFFMVHFYQQMLFLKLVRPSSLPRSYSLTAE